MSLEFCWPLAGANLALNFSWLDSCVEALAINLLDCNFTYPDSLHLIVREENNFTLIAMKSTWLSLWSLQKLIQVKENFWVPPSSVASIFPSWLPSKRHKALLLMLKMADEIKMPFQGGYSEARVINAVKVLVCVPTSSDSPLKRPQRIASTADNKAA